MRAGVGVEVGEGVGDGEGVGVDVGRWCGRGTDLDHDVIGIAEVASTGHALDRVGIDRDIESPRSVEIDPSD